MPEPLEILGRYKILRVIGRGAMGIVYEAVDPDIDRVVAIKTINLTLSPEEMVQYEARFKQEIKAAGRLNHPNIVTIYDVGKTDKFAYMAMEFINGCELKDLLKSGNALPIDVALEIVAQAAEGLAFAHSREIIHRDVKPSNIMLLENEEGMVAKITDFGIARMPASTVKTMTGMVMGSPRYMSPEQVVGRNLSARSDIFSLGVVLYEALTGTAPFEADSISSIMYQTVHAVEQPPSQINPNLGADLDAIVAKALAKSPDDRFETMKAFSRKLREVMRSRADETPLSLAQLRTSPGLAATPTVQTVMDLSSGAGESTVPLSIKLDFDGTRMFTAIPVVAEDVVEPMIPATAVAPAMPVPIAIEPLPLPAQTIPSPQKAAAERTVWPVAVANQFDSTIATLRLAEVTAQTGELSEFISASRQLPAYKEIIAQEITLHGVDTSSPAATLTANERAAITLTMDPLPMAPRKIPLPPLLLLGGLASAVMILLVAVVMTF